MEATRRRSSFPSSNREASSICSISWFIWSAANGYRQNDPAATDELFEEIERAFKEDEDVLVAQQASLRRVGDRPLINIASDGARTHARIALERKIAAERGVPRDQVVTTA